MNQSAVKEISAQYIVASQAGPESLITEHLGLWTSAITRKSTVGRGSSQKYELYGIKKLRELILELAVRGKLVPQDPNDEPASELLKRVSEKKSQLVTEGKIKKPKKLSKVSNEEMPFMLPNGWKWERLGNILNVLNGRAYKKHEMLQEGTPLLRVGNLFTSKEWYYSDLELEPEKYIDCGDLIYAWSASFGPFIWNGGKAIYHYHIWKFDIFRDDLTIKEYLYNYLSEVTDSIKASGNGIAMIHMTKEKMEQLPVPVCPAEEQHRVVAKVDELMALCDQLENQTEQSLDAHATLADTLLDALTQAQSAEELAENWQRLEANWDTLFPSTLAGERAIDKLKQTILQLAIMGKLVPQDPNDEPVSELLKRIAAEKEQLIADKKIKRQKPLQPITDDEKPFELPEGWEFTRIGVIVHIASGQGLTAANMNAEGSVPVYGGNGVTGWHDSGNVSKRTLVIGRVGYYCGSIHVTPERAWVTDNAFITTFSEAEIDIDFLSWLLKATDLKREDSATAQPVISGRKVYPIVVPLPPTDEQKRVVVKLTELFNQCDQLKQFLQAAQKAQKKITDAVVSAALRDSLGKHHAH